MPPVSLRDGLLADMAAPAAASLPGSLADFGRQVLASAEALGEKYRHDAVHARAVAHLAARLFDELKAEHGLDARDRLLLEVAALLHNIGVFVGLRAHHKHAQYLIQASEIFGLSSDDRAIIANVARYHRRGLPQQSHLPYMALDRTERVRVNKMAALLRIANALDAEHSQKVQDLRVTAADGTWLLEVEGIGDLAMERLKVEARADLFHDVFGRSARVARIGGPVVNRRRTGAAGSRPKGKRERTPDLFFNRELSWLAFNERVRGGGGRRVEPACSSAPSSRRSWRRTSTSSSWCASPG